MTSEPSAGDPAPAVLDLLCAGAAKGLVTALQEPFVAATGASIQGRFGAVGAMKEALLAGAPCDVMVVTATMIEALVAGGHLQASPVGVLGRVRTGVAVRANDPPPAIGTPDDLRMALLSADRIFFPDAERSTAGIHFAGVLRQLGIADVVGPRLATYPNGATAMRALGDASEPRVLGCTQITEINYTAGIRLVGALPKAFAAANAELGARLVALLSGDESRTLRLEGGFELDGP